MSFIVIISLLNEVRRCFQNNQEQFFIPSKLFHYHLSKHLNSPCYRRRLHNIYSILSKKTAPPLSQNITALFITPPYCNLHINLIGPVFRFFYLFLVLSCLLPMCLFIPPAFSHQLPALESNPLLDLEMKNQDFQKVIDAVAAKLNMTIVLHGEKPITKRNIAFSKMPLDQAIERIMRLYGVENHAEIFNINNNNLVRVDIHLYSITADVLNLQTQKLMDVSNGEKPLTSDQITNLIAQEKQIEEELNENSRPLTPEQKERLQLQGAALDAEINSGTLPLTPEQIEKLRERSLIIQLEEQNDHPLSFNQLQEMRQNSARIEAENDSAQRPLRKDQVLLLQERGDD